MAKLKQLLLATSNQGKFREMMEVLGILPYEILSLKDLGIPADAPEDGETFAENALQKAAYYSQKSRLLTVAEDSGIVVDALQGKLGVKTRRWGAGEKATDQEWIDYFLKVMEKVPHDQRGASFVCSAAIVIPEASPVGFEGKTEGVITQGLEAAIFSGLPLSSCFKPNGADKVYAALSVEEKNRLSHRGKAMKQVSEFLVAVPS